MFTSQCRVCTDKPDFKSKLKLYRHLIEEHTQKELAHALKNWGYYHES